MLRDVSKTLTIQETDEEGPKGEEGGSCIGLCGGKQTGLIHTCLSSTPASTPKPGIIRDAM